MKHVLKASNLTVNYQTTSVLWDVSFEIPPHQIIGILGPNGAGKSTLLQAAMKILKPLSGKIEIADGLRVAYVPQRESIDWDFPIQAFELVLMGCYGRLGWFGRPSKADRLAALAALKKVGMEKFAKRQISQLSGGQRQRLFIARALLQDADLYFMDEPFSGVDASTEETIFGLLKELKEEKKTIFVVHHDLASAQRYFDWCLLLNTRLIASGKKEEVFHRENLSRTYGNVPTLFDEISDLTQRRTEGIL